MPQINVTIDGKSYRMACGEGEEAHLAALAADLGARVAEMRKAFGEIGDMRLQVMAALTLSDEVSDLKRRLTAAEAETVHLRGEAAASAERTTAQEARVADTVVRVAERIDRMARVLAPHGVRPDSRDAP